MKTKKFGIEKLIIHRNPAMSTLLSIGHESQFCPICCVQVPILLLLSQNPAISFNCFMFFDTVLK